MKLETERLILRDFVEEDWQRVLEYQSDPYYLRYYSWTKRTPEDAKEFVDWFLEYQKQVPRIKFQLAITLKADQLLIGNCGIRMNKPNAFQADIGYEIDPKHWNHGYATEAAAAMVDWGFCILGLHRVWSWCVSDNLGSAHVLEKLGMRLEGRLVENEYYRGRYWDTLMYAILTEEWDAYKETHSIQWKQVKD